MRFRKKRNSADEMLNSYAGSGNPNEQKRGHNKAALPEKG